MPDNSSEPTARRTTRGRFGIFARFFCLAFAGAYLICWLGLVLECEFPFWPTLWLAEVTKTPDGSRVTDLIRSRSNSSYAHQHWHHCTYCEVIFIHVPHFVIEVDGDIMKRDFYLFDWQPSRRRLLPMTLHTAKTFPELIPQGYEVDSTVPNNNGQIYGYNDCPCLVVPKADVRNISQK